LIVTAVLLVAAFFRLYRLRTMPWGLSQDEVLNIDVATFVRDGYRPIFFQEGFGHEPLFHYLSAATVTLWGENVTGIRVPAVFCGLLLIGVFAPSRYPC
jgi:predicted membrane-bound mannosyltransferase